MKKVLYVIIACAALLLITVLNTSAETHGLYDNQLENSGASQLYDKLPEDAKAVFDSLDISLDYEELVNGINAKNIFGVIFGFITNGVKEPLAMLFGVLGVVLLCAAFQGMGAQKAVNDETVRFVSGVAIAGCVMPPLFSVLNATVAAIKGNGIFMLSFVPVYAGVITAYGQPSTASVSSAMLLFAAEAAVSIISYVVVPVMGCFMAVSLCSAISPAIPQIGITNGISKIATWVLCVTLVVFIGVLSIQTSITSSVDTVGMKAAKFTIGSAVPVVGASISEALGTVKSCVGLLKTTVGIYGVIAAAVIILPVVFQLLLWRVSLMLANTVAKIFDRAETSFVLKSAESFTAILLGICLFCLALFVICLTVVMKAGG